MKHTLLFKKATSMLFWSFALLFLLFSGKGYGQVNIIPKLYLPTQNTPSGNSGWTITSAATNNAGTDYWKMLTGSSLVTPAMNFSSYSGITITMSLQSFGTIASNSDKVKIEYFDGTTYSQVGALLATTSTKGNQSVSLPYTYNAAKIRITAPNASATAGARIYSVDITGTAAASAPGAPTIGTITPGNGQLSVAFTAPSSNGGATITDYKCSINGGTYFSLATTASPFVLSGLTNGTSYSVTIKAVNSVGDGAASNSVSSTPRTVPSASTITSITPGNGNLSVAFTSGADGGSAVTNYKYSLNGGSSFTAFSPAQTTSPVSISGLTNGTTYNVQLVAVNAAGDGAASGTVSGTPFTTPSVVTGFAVTEGNSQLSLAFTPGANGGLSLIHI
jgi:predicted RNA-binding protein with TRAM domain